MRPAIQRLLAARKHFPPRLTHQSGKSSKREADKCLEHEVKGDGYWSMFQNWYHDCPNLEPQQQIKGLAKIFVMRWKTRDIFSKTWGLAAQVLGAYYFWLSMRDSESYEVPVTKRTSRIISLVRDCYVLSPDSKVFEYRGELPEHKQHDHSIESADPKKKDAAAQIFLILDRLQSVAHTGQGLKINLTSGRPLSAKSGFQQTMEYGHRCVFPVIQIDETLLEAPSSMLVGTIAHEYAHLLAKHREARVYRDIHRFCYLFLLPRLAPVILWMTQLPKFPDYLGRRYEFEADAIAVALCTKSGFDPTGIIDALNADKAQAQTDSDAHGMSKTHPAHQARIDAMQRIIDRHQKVQTKAT